MPLSKSESDRIWREATFVFDANVLLNLYRYNTALREKLLKILANNLVKDRIWIPSKVYEEFLKNRATVICEQWSIEEKIEATIRDKFKLVAKEIVGAIPKHHPYVDSDKISTQLNDLANAIADEVRSSKTENYNIEISNDPILQKLVALLSDRIGDEIDESSLKKLHEEAKDRYKKKIPPGFMDDDKKEPEKYSDLVIWKSILQKAKSGVDVIFVSDDVKEDWIRKEKGKTIGPHPLLLQEFTNETGKKLIICDSRGFFDQIDSQLIIRTDLTKKENEALAAITSLSLFGIDDDIPIPKRKRNRLSTQNVVDWFFSNYKDPADGVPFDSREGGYMYINGGPYDPQEEIQSHFPNISEATLNSTLEEILPFGHDWVKKYEY